MVVMGCYIESRPRRTAGSEAIVMYEAGTRLWAEDASPVKVFSSLRTHCVLAVISVGQTTRLNFALCYMHALARRWTMVGWGQAGDGKNDIPWKGGIFVPIKSPMATGS